MSNGDTVLVAPGAYRGIGNRGLEFHGKRIVLRSIAGPGETIIDCERADRGIFMRGGETSALVVEGFTIANGGGVERGAGILLHNGASPTLRNLRLVSNVAGEDREDHPPASIAQGGGVYVDAGCSPVLEDMVIENNGCYATQEVRGGGVFCNAGSNVKIRASEIRRNGGRLFPRYGWSQGVSGGGIYCANGALIEIVNSRLAENEGGDYSDSGCGGTGAALWCDGNNSVRIFDTLIEQHDACGGTVVVRPGSRLLLERCQVVGNDGSVGVDSSAVAMRDCRFLSNDHGVRIEESHGVISGCEFRATGTLCQYTCAGGHALTASNGSELQIERCIFSGNRSTGSGAALQVGAATVHLTNCTIVGNMARGYDALGAIAVRYSSTATIQTSILADNCQEISYGTGSDVNADDSSDVTLICSAMQEFGATPNVRVIGPQVVTDPGLCVPPRCLAAPTEEGNLALTETSPCRAEVSPCGFDLGAVGVGCEEPSDCCREADGVGACCYDETQCLRLLEPACTTLGGTHSVGASCDPSPCVGGCCLDDGSCMILSELQCNTMRGSYRADVGSCETRPCGGTGACCLPDAQCVQTTLAGCVAREGVYLSDNMECPLTPCGPNQGGVLMLVSNPSLTYSAGTDYCGQAEVSECQIAQVETDREFPIILHALAAFPRATSPVVNAVDFGIQYTAGAVEIGDYGSCADLEEPMPNWPATTTGTTVRWVDAQQNHLFEVYWFAAYSDYDSPALISLAPYPGVGARFRSGFDDRIDPVVCLGKFGIDRPGIRCCPVEPLGACCTGGEACRPALRDDCAAQEGSSSGSGSIACRIRVRLPGSRISR
ncbi:MAG: right-handed parallel beta-helix repeat-containing protein [Candidatus Eisenbacteria bacterium]|nr:right-handed parallel beta-helix repeat-containing protein [Candidatus Eisenbacteria bacterium]